MLPNECEFRIGFLDLVFQAGLGSPFPTADKLKLQIETLGSQAPYRIDNMPLMLVGKGIGNIQATNGTSIPAWPGNAVPIVQKIGANAVRYVSDIPEFPA